MFHVGGTTGLRLWWPVRQVKTTVCVDTFLNKRILWSGQPVFGIYVAVGKPLTGNMLNFGRVLELWRTLPLLLQNRSDPFYAVYALCQVPRSENILGTGRPVWLIYDDYQNNAVRYREIFIVKTSTGTWAILEMYFTFTPRTNLSEEGRLLPKVCSDQSPGTMTICRCIEHFGRWWIL